MKCDQILNLAAEEQAFENGTDNLTKLVQTFAPIDDELDIDALEHIAAAGNSLSFAQFQRILETKLGKQEKR